MAGAVSTTVADVIVPKGNFGKRKYGQQRGYSNQTAASELYSGAKSKKVPIHDSMGGYDGSVPKQSDTIVARAKRRGYLVAS